MGNCTDVVFSFQVYIGSRGVVNLTGALHPAWAWKVPA